MKRAWILLLNAICALANTEIANFAAKSVQDPDIHFLHEWPVLDARYSSLRWNLDSNPPESINSVNKEPCSTVFTWSPSQSPESCLTEAWFVLDLDSPDWEEHSKFTVRLSWPASYPVDAYLKVFEPADLAPLPRPGPPRHSRHRPPGTETRKKYVRIQLVSTAVWTPAALNSSGLLDLLSNVPLIVTLEPLLFGILPESVVPTIGALVIFAVLGVVIASTITIYLEGITKPGPKEPSKTD